MEHIIQIISKLKKKKDGKLNYIIHTHIKVSQEEIEQYILKEYLDHNSMIKEDREYYAELTETKY